MSYVTVKGESALKILPQGVLKIAPKTNKKKHLVL